MSESMTRCRPPAPRRRCRPRSRRPASRSPPRPTTLRDTHRRRPSTPSWPRWTASPSTPSTLTADIDLRSTASARRRPAVAVDRHQPASPSTATSARSRRPSRPARAASTPTSARSRSQVETRFTPVLTEFGAALGTSADEVNSTADRDEGCRRDPAQQPRPGRQRGVDVSLSPRPRAGARPPHDRGVPWRRSSPSWSVAAVAARGRRRVARSDGFPATDARRRRGHPLVRPPAERARRARRRLRGRRPRPPRPRGARRTGRRRRRGGSTRSCSTRRPARRRRSTPPTSASARRRRSRPLAGAGPVAGVGPAGPRRRRPGARRRASVVAPSGEERVFAVDVGRAGARRAGRRRCGRSTAGRWSRTAPSGAASIGRRPRCRRRRADPRR